jgi:hypothetical protein
MEKHSDDLTYLIPDILEDIEKWKSDERTARQMGDLYS